MVAEKSTAIKNVIVVQQDRVTKILGDISPEVVDTLEEEVVKVLATVSSTFY